MCISFDEWNTWYSWYRAYSVTDALFAASVMHFLINESNSMGISKACYFESVNEGAIDIAPDKAVLNATGKVFALMNKHAGGKLLFSGRNVVATEKEDFITITLLNRAYDSEKHFTLNNVRGDVLKTVSYTSDSILSYSDFKEDTWKTSVANESINVTLPRTFDNTYKNRKNK